MAAPAQNFECELYQLKIRWTNENLQEILEWSSRDNKCLSLIRERLDILGDTVTLTCFVPEQEPCEPLAAFLVTKAGNSISKRQLQYHVCCNCRVKRGIFRSFVVPLASVRTSQRTRSVSIVTTNGINVSRPEYKISNVYYTNICKSNSVKINIKITKIVISK